MNDVFLRFSCLSLFFKGPYMFFDVTAFIASFLNSVLGFYFSDLRSTFPFIFPIIQSPFLVKYPIHAYLVSSVSPYWFPGVHHLENPRSRIVLYSKRLCYVSHRRIFTTPVNIFIVSAFKRAVTPTILRLQTSCVCVTYYKL